MNLPMLETEDVIGWTIWTGGTIGGTIGFTGDAIPTGLFGNDGGCGFGGGPVVGTNPAPIEGTGFKTYWQDWITSRKKKRKKKSRSSL